jgi:exonuclease SbcC
MQNGYAIIRDEKTKLHLENSRVASEYKLKSDAIQKIKN